MRENDISIFHAMGLSLYILKTSENQKFSDVFCGVLKDISGIKLVKRKN